MSKVSGRFDRKSRDALFFRILGIGFAGELDRQLALELRHPLRIGRIRIVVQNEDALAEADPIEPVDVVVRRENDVHRDKVDALIGEFLPFGHSSLRSGNLKPRR